MQQKEVIRTLSENTRNKFKRINCLISMWIRLRSITVKLGNKCLMVQIKNKEKQYVVELNVRISKGHEYFTKPQHENTLNVYLKRIFSHIPNVWPTYNRKKSFLDSIVTFRVFCKLVAETAKKSRNLNVSILRICWSVYVFMNLFVVIFKAFFA